MDLGPWHPHEDAVTVHGNPGTTTPIPAANPGRRTSRPRRARSRAPTLLSSPATLTAALKPRHRTRIQPLQQPIRPASQNGNAYQSLMVLRATPEHAKTRAYASLAAGAQPLFSKQSQVHSQYHTMFLLSQIWVWRPCNSRTQGNGA